MASNAPSPQSRSYYLSPEECQELFGDFGSGAWASDIPEHHKEILEERIADYCRNGMHGISIDDFEKELLEELMQG